MISGTFYGGGEEGLIYRCEDDSVLKIFYRLSPSSFTSKEPLCEVCARREYDNLSQLFAANINVPKPIALERIIMDPLDLKDVGKIKFREFAKDILFDSFELIGKELPAIRREFIPGKNLYSRFIPSRRIRKKIQELHEQIDRMGLALAEVKADNYVLTFEGKVYLIDCGLLFSKNSLIALANSCWKQKKIATCKFEDWFVGMIESVVSYD